MLPNLDLFQADTKATNMAKVNDKLRAGVAQAFSTTERKSTWENHMLSKRKGLGKMQRILGQRVNKTGQ